MPKIIYCGDALKKTMDAIASVNKTAQPVRVGVGKTGALPLTLYLAVSENGPEFDDEDDEESYGNRAGLYFSIFAGAKEIGGGCWTAALMSDDTPIPTDELKETAQSVLDECERQGSR